MSVDGAAQGLNFFPQIVGEIGPPGSRIAHAVTGDPPLASL
jgi:hypothetical protein